jgi:large subunit GTPase 1
VDFQQKTQNLYCLHIRNIEVSAATLTGKKVAPTRQKQTPRREETRRGAMGGARNGGKTPKNAGALGGLLTKARRGGQGSGGKTRVHEHGGGEHINYAHTTDILSSDGAGSVLERSELDEFFHLAALANRDFTAERRGQPVVVAGPGGAVGPGASPEQEEAAARARGEAESAHKDALSVPRRPKWTHDTSAEELDLNERQAFLEWRRALVQVEEDLRCSVTPFEKNLEIWRQLWRVCERSDVVVQVVDARDPLFYRCEDLETYVKELNPGKTTMLLLNKADLLSKELRRAWAEYFEAKGISFLFWSAKAAYEEIEAEQIASRVAQAAKDLEETKRRLELHNAAATDDDAMELTAELDAKVEAARSAADAHAEALHQMQYDSADKHDPAHILSRAELLDILQKRAEDAVAAMGSSRPARQGAQAHRVVVGMVGYPNVGKSSTVNAIVASKKTGVSATPGKTKHFQTLELGDDLLLADCPGLVFPSFTSSKAHLVCNGVIPIDRLTDVTKPIEIIASRIPRATIEHVYNLKLPLPALHEDQNRNATAREFLRAYCAARGYTVQGNRPDEVRAGRAVLKDYISGKLLYCVGPDGYEGPMGASRVGEDAMMGYGAGAIVSKSETASNSLDSGATDDPLAAAVLDDMMATLGINNKQAKERKRAEHKYQKKGKKEKGRVKYKDSGVNTTVGGQGFLVGKRGGMMPAHLQAQVRSALGEE